MTDLVQEAGKGLVRASYVLKGERAPDEAMPSPTYLRPAVPVWQVDLGPNWVLSVSREPQSRDYDKIVLQVHRTRLSGPTEDSRIELPIAALTVLDDVLRAVRLWPHGEGL